MLFTFSTDVHTAVTDAWGLKTCAIFFQSPSLTFVEVELKQIKMLYLLYVAVLQVTLYKLVLNSFVSFEFLSLFAVEISAA